MEVEEKEGCQCSDENEYHSCPFAEEVNGNYSEEFCNCCAECAYQCSQDI